jgi:hypothetical protein
MRNLLRPVAVLATGIVVTTTLAAPAQAAPADRGGEWLQTQLTDGIVHNDEFDFDDLGLTADVGLAFAALGQRPAMRRVRNALAGRVDSYTTGADFGAPGEIYAGATAKLTVLAQVSGADARSYGGVDVVRRLERRVSNRAPIVGRIRDKAASDFSNSIGQAFAARGLARAGSGKAGGAIRFLLKQQCSAGYFRLTFSRPGKRNQSCDAGAAGVSAPDTDVTALAVLSLRSLPRSQRTRATRAAVADAVAWMRRTQKRNGSFGGGVATEASNANSTGLAAWALGESGVCRPARKAARWVRALQVAGDTAGTPLEGENGAIAYDQAALTTASGSGITDGDRDQWRRATAQAAPGLAYVGGC